MTEMLFLLQHDPAYLNVCVTFFALVAGSFLNAAAHRLPILWGFITVSPPAPPGRFSMMGRSQCPHCDYVIPWYQNIPVISYLMLGGRCHQCNAPIPRRYLFVELLTPLIAFMLADHFGPEFGLVLLGGVLLLSWLLILMALIDFNTLMVPRPLNLALIFGGVIWHTLHARELPIDFVSGAILGYLMLSAISWCASKVFGQQAMGGGDVLMFAGTGAWLGLNNVVDALWLSAVVGLALWFVLKRPLHIPFAPAIGLTTFSLFLVNFG